MGQAFDNDGHMIDALFGETKREVFDRLTERNPDAAEIRIKTVQDMERRILGASAEMPRYRSYKEVWALKIQEVLDPAEPGNESDGSRVLRFEDHRYAPIRMDREYVHKHAPQAGGYYVVYKDGYKSWSPADAFEEGYMRIDRQ